MFIVGNNNLGGTGKYIRDLCSFSIKEISFITNKYELNNSMAETLLIQQLTHTDITCDDLIDSGLKYYITIHDFCWFNKKINFVYSELEYHGIYLTKVSIRSDVLKLFSKAKTVIFPSRFIMNEYSKYFRSRNFLYCPHIDEKININQIRIKTNLEINIGICHNFIICKGKNLLEHLSYFYRNYKGLSINFIRVEYDETNFYEKLEEYNIHGLTALNVYGESYCYALTKFMNSGLPIIYNNIGSFKERIPKTKHYFPVFDNELDIVEENYSILNAKFEKFLDYLMTEKRNIVYNMHISSKLSINPFYFSLCT